jgi:purine nucleoside permease
VINASLALARLVASPLFDLRRTYFLISGIAGTNPAAASLGSVALARYAVQVDLQTELDARDMPAAWPTGYVPLGARAHDAPPATYTGTEVFALSAGLRDAALALAERVCLVDSDAAAADRATYAHAPAMAAAARPPRVLAGDVTASNVFFHGPRLAEAFERVCAVYTAGRAAYCMTAMEDSGTLAALLRGAQQGRCDFARVLLMRAASNYDRPPPGRSDTPLPFVMDRGGLAPAARNLYLVGLEFVRAVLADWATYGDGIAPDGYVGDVFGSLGGRPDFGPA